MVASLPLEDTGARETCVGHSGQQVTSLGLGPGPVLCVTTLWDTAANWCVDYSCGQKGLSGVGCHHIGTLGDEQREGAWACPRVREHCCHDRGSHEVWSPLPWPPGHVLGLGSCPGSPPPRKELSRHPCAWPCPKFC